MSIAPRSDESDNSKLGTTTETEEVSVVSGELDGVAEEGADSQFCVVGIGASAGGLRALEEFCEALPDKPGMAFIVLQHLDPNHKTSLPELLAKHCNLGVLLADDGMSIEVDNVYISPPGAHLTVGGRTIHLDRTDTNRKNRAPIDLFLRSLAHAEKEKAIGIILSGSGSDGTLGIKEIKEAGGMTMVHDPETAEHDSMPRSAIQTGLIDFVLSPGEMPEKLGIYGNSNFYLTPKQKETSSELTDSIGAITTILRRTTGHDFREYRRSMLARRIQRRISILNLENSSEYITYLQNHPGESENLYRDFLISVTHFFRDREAFDALVTEGLPSLIQGGEEGTSNSFRVWIPGCATGEEAYSIAMLLLDYCESHNLSREIKIFATDIDLSALEVARRGIYPEGIASQLPDDYLQRFFTSEDHTFKVTRQVRELIVFSPHNLLRDPPFSRLDLISCRNLLIYLETEEQRRLMRVLHYAMRPGGILFLGSSENVATHLNLFHGIDRKHRLFRRNDSGIGATSPRLTVDIAEALYGKQPAPTPQQTVQSMGDRGAIERIVLREYSPGYVVVDVSRQILLTSGNTSDYLELPQGDISTNIVDMARPGIRMELRSALYEAFRTLETVTTGPLPVVSTQGQKSLVRLVVRPISVEDSEQTLAMILFQNLGSPESQVGQESTTMDNDHPTVIQLEDELRSTREQLQTTIEELETTNEELKSSNEELLSMNEELQSSNEELQTSKEEIQSINEELATVNTALDHKVEELNVANSDLQYLLQSTHIPTIFVGRNQRIKWFTPEAEKVFRVIESDVGRHVSDLKSRFPDVDVEKQISNVLEALTPFEKEVYVEETECSYILKILPYQTVGNVVDGVVITFLDISSLRRAETGERYLQAMFEHVPEGIMVVDAESMETRFVSREGYRMLGRDASYYNDPIVEGEESTLLRNDGVTRYEYDELPLVRAIRKGETVRNERVYFISNDRLIPLICTAAPIPDENGRIVAAVATWRDISDLETAREELQESHENYRSIASELESLYHYMPIGISVLDENLRYVRINKYLADVHGISIDDHIGKNPFELVPELRETVEPIVQNVLKTGESAIDLEIMTPRLNSRADDEDAGTGDVSYWYASYFRLIHDEGRPYVVSIVRNITNKRESQIALEKSEEKLSELNEQLEMKVQKRTEQVRALSAALAMAERSERRRLSFLLHDDLQQILFGIEMKIQLLQNQTHSEGGESNREVSAIETGLNEAEETLRQAIEVTRTLSVELNPPLEHDSSVEAALQWIAEHMKKRHGLEIALDVHEEVRMENVDMRALMVQLVRELLFNVIKHSGTLRARIVVREIPDDCISIMVEDDGKGFEPDDLQRGEGNGLGLYSIRERVSVVGGDVQITSSPGGGTSITVTMPISP